MASPERVVRLGLLRGAVVPVVAAAGRVLVAARDTSGRNEASRRCKVYDVTLM